MNRQSIIIACGLLLLPSLAFGGDPSSVATSPALAPPDLGGVETTLSIIKLIAAFMVVAGVMALVFKLMGKFGPTSQSKSGLIEVLDTRMIAQKKYISVVRIGGEDFAVAISDNNLTLLCTLNGVKTPQPQATNTEFNKAMEAATNQGETQP